MDDVADFFLDFIVNDRVGQICSMHAVLADQSEIGALDHHCVMLSRLGSTAVDFPKTGVPVNMKEAPRVNMRVKPDFMAQQPLHYDNYIPGHSTLSGGRRHRGLYYESFKVLGEMYRRVDIPKLLHTWNINSGWNEDGPLELWQDIEQNLRRLVPPYQPTWPDYVAEAQDNFTEYMEELQHIQKSYHPTFWDQSRLSEAEVFLQCIRMDTSKRSTRGRGRNDYLYGLRAAYNTLVEEVRSVLLKSVDGRFQRAAACFYVGIDIERLRRGIEGQSFAWILVPDLFDAWRQVQKNGFVDGKLHGDQNDADLQIYSSHTATAQPVETVGESSLREIMRRFGVQGI
jgi:hypothetical protein